jgi:hypothetical protein
MGRSAPTGDLRPLLPGDPPPRRCNRGVRPRGRGDGLPGEGAGETVVPPAVSRPHEVFGWYDNEWGYTNCLLDLTALVADD